MNLPQSQVSIRAGKTFQNKLFSKPYRNDELNFLVNFNLIILVLKRSQGKSKLTEGCSRLFRFSLNNF